MARGRLELAQYREDPADDGVRRRRYNDQEDSPEYDSRAEGRRPFLTHNQWLGLAAMAVPGGAFLLWTDPALDHPFIGKKSGLFFGAVTAATGFYLYGTGKILPGLLLHTGTIAAGVTGHQYASFESRGEREAKGFPIGAQAKLRF